MSEYQSVFILGASGGIGSALARDLKSQGNQVILGGRDGEKLKFEGSHLLLAAGRTPNINDLNLEVAGIEPGRGGIPVNARMQTVNKRVYAIGDVVEGHNFTHVAG